MYGLIVDDTTYHIAVVDDGAGERELMHALAVKYFGQHPDKDYEVQEYQKGEDLLFDLENRKYFDLYYLDVEMPGVSGLELARKIKEFHPEVSIVFVTNHVEYAPQAFELNAFRFIPKRLLEEKLPESLDHILPKIDQKDQRVHVIEVHDGVEKIYFKNIRYISKDGKYIDIHHANGNSRKRKSLAQIMKELHSPEFIYIDKSYIVNLRQIVSMVKNEVILKSDIRLPVSRSRQKEVKEQIAAYWRAQG